MVCLDDFKKIELRVAKVIQAEKVEGSGKILKLKIEIGQESKQILAGIGKFYNPGDLIGKAIVVVANLEPKNLLGYESQGMLLAADNNGEPVLLVPDKNINSGDIVQ